MDDSAFSSDAFDTDAFSTEAWYIMMVEDPGTFTPSFGSGNSFFFYYRTNKGK